MWASDLGRTNRTGEKLAATGNKTTFSFFRVTSCGLLELYRRFGRWVSFHLHVSPFTVIASTQTGGSKLLQLQYTSTRLRCVTSQKIIRPTVTTITPLSTPHTLLCYVFSQYSLTFAQVCFVVSFPCVSQPKSFMYR
jgi:hypothetical protein